VLTEVNHKLMAKVSFDFGNSGYGGRGEGLMDMHGGDGWGAINEDDDMDFM